MGIRKGSIVNIITAEIGGPGTNNGSENGATVIDVEDGYILVQTQGGSSLLFPWRSVRQVSVTTY